VFRAIIFVAFASKGRADMGDISKLDKATVKCKKIMGFLQKNVQYNSDKFYTYSGSQAW
jgi:hypothetical protein